MTHWLEEAEAKVQHRKNKKIDSKDRIENKKEDVKLNRDLIENDYLDLIDQMTSIIQRINDLPRHNRSPFGHIYAKKIKNSKMDNLLIKFFSSRRVDSKEYESILKPFKKQHYKNSRSFFMSIGRKKGEILLEYKEILVKRVRLNNNTNRFWNKIRLRSLFSKQKEINDVKENIVNIPIKDFNTEFIYQHMDWLAFKSDGEIFFKK